MLEYEFAWASAKEELASGGKLVGAKQSAKAIRDGRAKAVILAADADVIVTRPIEELCAQTQTPLCKAESMKALGKACGVEVGAAVAVLLK